MLNWTDNSVSATNFTVERTGQRPTVTTPSPFRSRSVKSRPVVRGPTPTRTAVAATAYSYRVKATNTVGSTVPNYPGLTVESAWTNTVTVPAIAQPPITAPANLVATIATATRVTLTWTDLSNNENNFAIWRSTNGGAFAQIGTLTRTLAQGSATGGTVTFNSNGVSVGNTYAYYVTAVKTSIPAGVSNPSNTVTVPFTVPAAPTSLVGQQVPANLLQTTVTLTWVDNALNETGFRVQRCQRTTNPNSCGTNGTWTNITPVLPADTDGLQRDPGRGRSTGPIASGRRTSSGTPRGPTS